MMASDNLNPRQIIKMCEALAEGHYRRGITPEMYEWRRSFETLAEGLEQVEARSQSAHVEISRLDLERAFGAIR